VFLRALHQPLGQPQERRDLREGDVSAGPGQAHHVHRRDSQRGDLRDRVELRPRV